jgi:hypothetical protein
MGEITRSMFVNGVADHTLVELGFVLDNGQLLAPSSSRVRLIALSDLRFYELVIALDDASGTTISCVVPRTALKITHQ